MRGIVIACILWMFSSVLNSYAVFLNSESIVYSSALLNLGSYSAWVATIVRWIYLVVKKHRQRQGGGAIIDFGQLTMEEYNCFAYLLPMIFYIPASFAWTVITGDQFWYNHSEENCVYIICVHIAFGLYVISKYLVSFTLHSSIADDTDNCDGMYCSCARPHHAHIGSDQHRAAELEANIRTPCISRDKVTNSVFSKSMYVCIL